MAQARTVQVGDVLGGHFRIEGLIAEGGMGIVYRGTNLGTGKACAIKVILPHLADRPGVLDRFQQEAQIGGTIGESPHIVSVLFASVDAERRVPYFVMELLVGESVEALIAQPLEATRVSTLVEQLGEALDQAHERGVVHRDLKPSNLYVTRDRKQRPVLKVLDFGIAKLLEGAGTATELGTPAYAAPEQLGPLFRRMAMKSGIEIADHVTPQTDLWAMGLIAYEMLVGGKPGQYWDATTAQEIGAAMTMALTSPTRPSERAGDRARLLPAGFDGWFLRCLEMDARKRWSSAGEAAAALAALTAGADALYEPEPGTSMGAIGVTGVVGVVGTSLDHIADFSPQAPAVLAATPAPTPPRGKPEGPETQLGAAIPTYIPETRPSPPPSTPSPSPSSRSGGKLGVAVVGTLVALGVVGGVLGRSRPSTDASVAPSSTGSSTPSPPVASVPAPPPSCPEGMEAIPGGTFKMGSEDGDPDEKPVHEVSVAAFCMDRTEVTVTAYKACVEAGECTKDKLTESYATPTTTTKSPYCNWDKPDRGNHPINCVDWTQATAYCKSVKKRLPTEEEWEYGARGEEGRKYPWGSEAPAKQLCWNGEGNDLGKGKRPSTCAVGSYAAGVFGLRDMAGNVWEWTSSGYSEDYGKPRRDERRVIRGGGWNIDVPSWVRGALRFRDAPSNRDDILGFRCSRG